MDSSNKRQTHSSLYSRLAGDLQGSEMAQIFSKALPAISHFTRKHKPSFGHKNFAKITRFYEFLVHSGFHFLQLAAITKILFDTPLVCGEAVHSLAKVRD